MKFPWPLLSRWCDPSLECSAWCSDFARWEQDTTTITGQEWMWTEGTTECAALCTACIPFMGTYKTTLFQKRFKFSFQAGWDRNDRIVDTQGRKATAKELWWNEGTVATGRGPGAGLGWGGGVAVGGCGLCSGSMESARELLGGHGFWSGEVLGHGKTRGSCGKWRQQGLGVQDIWQVQPPGMAGLVGNTCGADSGGWRGMMSMEVSGMGEGEELKNPGRPQSPSWGEKWGAWATVGSQR